MHFLKWEICVQSV